MCHINEYIQNRNTPKTYKIKQFSIAAFTRNVDHEGELIVHPPDPLILGMQLYMKQIKKCISLMSVFEMGKNKVAQLNPTR